jgi:hypothetical protein
MISLRWTASLLAVAGLLMASTAAQAQSVQVQGQVQYQPYGQQPAPQGYGNPPPGYGQPYPQPAQQPHAQPYAPTYQQRQVRYVERQATIKGLWIPGIIIFGVSYGLTASFGQLGPDADYRTWTAIPLIGPWVALGTCELCNDDAVTGAVLGGVGQAAGLTMFILGLTLRRTVRVATYSFDEDDARAPQLALDALPLPGGGRIGLTLSHF